MLFRSTNIEQFYANPTLPKTDATVNEQSRAMSIAGALVQSNHGEAGFAQLNQGNVAELARLIAKGDPSVTVERKMIGGVDTPVTASATNQLQIHAAGNLQTGSVQSTHVDLNAAGNLTGGSRDIQWGWNPVGGSRFFDDALTPNNLVCQTELGTVTVVTN